LPQTVSATFAIRKYVTHRRGKLLAGPMDWTEQFAEVTSTCCFVGPRPGVSSVEKM
jgi:hypothetical protein